MPALHTLHCSADEIERARRRLRDPAWAPAAERLRRAVERDLAAMDPVPDFDTGWFDAQPDRDFGETYHAFHAFIQPAKRVAQRAAAFARGALLLDDPRCTERARRDLVLVVDRLSFHPRHHDSGMEYGQVAAALAEALAALGDVLSAPERDRVRARLDEAAAAILDGTRHWRERLAYMPYSNHLAFQRRGLLAIGLALERPGWVAEAIDGPRGFGEMVAGAAMDDGLCYESSTSYHFATFGALLDMAELVRHRPALGRDLYRETFANGRSLRQWFDAPLGLLWPNGEAVCVGDCYARRAPFWTDRAGVYEHGYAVYGDPRYAWLLRRAPRAGEQALLFGADELPGGEPPGGRTHLWPEHAYVLLTAREGAAYWNPADPAPAAFLSADRNGIHHHRDRLGLQIAGAGRLWLEDVESHAVAADGHSFAARIQGDFNRTSLSHNLVRVDERCPRTGEMRLELRAFKGLPGVRTAAYADPGGVLYEGVAQSRAVAVTADYALDVVLLSSPGRPRVCDLLLHPRADGPAAAGDLAFAPDTTLPATPPYTVLRRIESAPFAGGLELAWRQGDAACAAAVRVFEGEADRVFRAEWPTQSDGADAWRELFWARARGERVGFVTLYRIAAGGGSVAPAWRVRAAERVFNGQHDEIRICVTDGVRDQRHVFEGLDGTDRGRPA